MSPASFTACIFRDQFLGFGERKLAGGEAQGRGRNLSRVFEKDAQHAQRSELDGDTQTIVIAAKRGDERAIGVVEVEVAGQLVGRRFPVEAGILPSLTIA